jgi:LCP family protein required for cell wall assembly
MTESVPRSSSGRRPRPVVSAILSFLIPGLGQLWAGAWRRGLLFLAPLVLLLALAIAAFGGRSTGYLVGSLLQPPVLLALIALNLIAIAYRVAAIVDAYRTAARRAGTTGLGRRSWTSGVVVALVVITVMTHAGLAYVSYAAYDVVTGVFAGGTAGGFEPDESPSASLQPSTEPPSMPSPTRPTSSPTLPPTASPRPTPEVPGWAADGRFDVLLLGADSGPGRFGLRTDTIILASVEVRTGRAALFGIPRNLYNVPLPTESAHAFQCRCFPAFFFGLYKYASDHPALFPGNDEQRGLRAVAGSVEELTGIELDGLVLIDLHGFIDLIDAIGGLDITVPERIVDNAYPKEDGSGDIRIVIEAGRQHMDGTQALRFARTRHQDDDYHRMGRQQQVLVALRKQMNVCSLLPHIPELVDIAKRTLTTDIRYGELPTLLELAARVDSDRIARTAFTPPEIPEALRPQDISRIRQQVADAFEGPLPPSKEQPDEGGPC